MKSTVQNTKLTDRLQLGVLNCLWYYHYFEHPLYTSEIHRFLETPTTLPQLESTLKKLLAKRKIEYKHGYWCLPGATRFCRLRRKNHLLNMMHLYKARKIAKLIAIFPFVKGVGVTGSLSKMGSNPQADIDFLIITKHGRLWLCKFFLILYKKLILLNSHKNFCLNLFRSENNLLFNNQNQYIATEIATVIPLVGKSVFTKFFEENKWTTAYFPNWQPKDNLNEILLDETKVGLKEKILSHPYFDRLENWARKQFAKHIIKKRKEGSGFYTIAVNEAAIYPDNPQNRILNYLSLSPFKEEN